MKLLVGSLTCCAHEVQAGAPAVSHCSNGATKGAPLSGAPRRKTQYLIRLGLGWRVVNTESGSGGLAKFPPQNRCRNHMLFNLDRARLSSLIGHNDFDGRALKLSTRLLRLTRLRRRGQDGDR